MYFLLIPTENKSKAVLQQLVTSEMYLGISDGVEDLLESQDSPIDPGIDTLITSLKTRPYNPLNFSSNLFDTSASSISQVEVCGWLYNRHWVANLQYLFALLQNTWLKSVYVPGHPQQNSKGGDQAGNDFSFWLSDAQEEKFQYGWRNARATIWA